MGLDGYFYTAGFINYGGKSAVIQCNDGQPVAERFEDYSRGVFSHAGNAEYMTAAHDAECFLAGDETVESYDIIQPEFMGEFFPCFHARAFAQHVQFHFFFTMGQGLQQQVQSFAGNMLTGPADAQGGAVFVGRAACLLVACFKSDLIHEYGFATPESADFLHCLGCARQNCGGMSCSGASGASPAFLDAVDYIADAKMDGAAESQASEQAPRRICKAAERSPDEWLAEFLEETRFAEAGDGDLVNDIEVFLLVQFYCQLICLAVPGPVEPVIAGRPDFS